VRKSSKRPPALRAEYSERMSQPAALIVIDAQKGFDADVWGPTHNPACNDNIEALLTLWRDHDWPVVLVRHDSASATSPLSPGQSGNELYDGVAGKHDLLVTKTVNSAFYGTPDLHEWLTANNLKNIVICGITTNFCCETTARMAGNLGYDVTFAIDATRTFDVTLLDGTVVPAATVAAMTAANLHGEFATVRTTAEIVSAARQRD
jgi:nicotinamidase-related amidase